MRIILLLSLYVFVNLKILGRDGGSFKAIEKEFDVQSKPNAQLLP